MRTPRSSSRLRSSQTSPVRRLTRRSFIQTGSWLAAATWVPVWTGVERSMAAESRSANARPLVGCIGNGGMGRGDAMNASRYGDLVAFCDVDRSHAEGMNQKVAQGRGKLYADYRQLLDRQDIEIVTVSTPDHWHTKIAAEAMLAGKDVYCQKPLTLTIDEGKLLCRVARKTGRVLQVGSQQRSAYNNRFLKAVALAQSGRIGKIRRVTCVLGTAPSGGPFAAATPPAHLDWNAWLGQAPLVDYIPQRCHGTFRWWYEYSGGKMTDWGAHHVDIAQWAIGRDDSGPEKVEVLTNRHPVPFAKGYPTIDNAYNTVVDFRLRCLFAGGVEMIICNRAPELELRNGVMIEGEKGSFWVTRGDMDGEPVRDLEKNPIPEAVLVKLRKGKPLGSHMGNFFSCANDRSLPVSDVFSHHRTLTTCHLANIALRLDRTLRWDPEKEMIPGDAEANAFLAREPRKGYELPA